MQQQYKVWYGPFDLNLVNINSYIVSGYAGTYVLSSSNTLGQIYFRYIGRSDENVNQRLQQWIGKYAHFHFLYCETPAEAYWYECENYHSLQKQGYRLENDIHPAKPSNFVGRCHHCGQ